MDTSQRLQIRIGQLQDIGFIQDENGDWIETSSELIIHESDLAVMSDEVFVKNLEFIEYVLSK